LPRGLEFDANEIYVNGGGRNKFARHLGSITNRNDPAPRVCNVRLVRKGNGSVEAGMEV
jgi:hypothetical protein